MELLRFRLDSIETLLEFGQKEKSRQKLKELKVPDSHPFASRTRFLLGKSYALTGNFKRSDRMFSNAIRLERQHDHHPRSNLEACSYYELCRSAIRQNLPEQALEYTHLGLRAFDPDGERQQIQYLLKTDRAGILLQLSRFGESLKLVDELWKERPQIQPVRVLIQLYLLRVRLLRKTGMLQQAVACAREGLEIARINRDHLGTFELWSALGDVYQSGQNWIEAEACLELALQLDQLMENREGLIHLYNRLGALYLRRKKWEQAEEMMNRAIRLGEEGPGTPLLMETLTLAGDLYRQTGETEKAIQRFERALQLSEKHRFWKRRSRSCSGWPNATKKRTTGPSFVIWKICTGCRKRRTRNRTADGLLNPSGNGGAPPTFWARTSGLPSPHLRWRRETVLYPDHRGRINFPTPPPSPAVSQKLLPTTDGPG